MKGSAVNVENDYNRFGKHRNESSNQENTLGICVSLQALLLVKRLLLFFNSLDIQMVLLSKQPRQLEKEERKKQLLLSMLGMHSK